jgi:hypothetical protein
MAQQLKRWESPRREGRNHKGRGGSARQRQKQKQMKALRQKLKQEQSPDNPKSNHSQLNKPVQSGSKKGRDVKVSSFFNGSILVEGVQARSLVMGVSSMRMPVIVGVRMSMIVRMPMIVRMSVSMRMPMIVRMPVSRLGLHCG